MSKKKAALSAREKRRLRTQQILFAAIAIMIILTMVISLAKF